MTEILLEEFSVSCRHCEGSTFKIRGARRTDIQAVKLKMTLTCCKCGKEIRMGEHTASIEAGLNLATEKI